MSQQEFFEEIIYGTEIGLDYQNSIIALSKKYPIDKLMRILLSENTHIF